MDNHILDLLNSLDPIEPETLTLFNVEENDRLKILSMWSIKHTIGPWMYMDAFENCVHALNNLPVEPNHIEGCLPQHFWKALPIFFSLKNEEFSDEVRLYIKFWLRESGILFYPPFEYFKPYQPKWFDKMIFLAENGPFPLTDKDFLSLQAIYYLKYNQKE